MLHVHRGTKKYQTPKKITEWKIKSFQLIFVSQFPTSYKISNFPYKKKIGFFITTEYKNINHNSEFKKP